MNDKAFKKLVAEGIDRLPAKILAKLKNVAVTIADKPTEEQRRAHDLSEGEALFGLYEGVPQTERDVGYVALPDKITIFKKPILESYESLEDIRACVENTVWHEVAHHFGMDEAQVEREEERRGKTL